MGLPVEARRACFRSRFGAYLVANIHSVFSRGLEARRTATVQTVTLPPSLLIWQRVRGEAPYNVH